MLIAFRDNEKRGFEMKERLSLRGDRLRGNRTADGAPQVNRSLVIGLCGSCLLVIFGASLGGRPLTFISFEGLLLVLGGTIASTLVQFSILDVRNALRAVKAVLFQHQDSPTDRMKLLIRLSRQVKADGMLVLEDQAARTTDTFLCLGLQLTVDGQEPADIARILQTEMKTSNDQAWRSVQVFETMGNFAPAMGLIGTLIGLIQMLGSLQEAATIGPAMSLALVATLYGSVAANLFFFPLAGKLRGLAQERGQTKDITIEGLLSVARAESPILLEQRLQSFVVLAANH